jgi:hypothetical protein
VAAAGSTAAARCSPPSLRTGDSPAGRNRRQLDKLRYIIPPRNWKLYETSSWINYYLKYDHSAVKIELPERAE